MQQINLLSADLKPAREVLAPAQVFAVLGSVVVLLFLASAAQGIRIYLLDAEKAALERELTALASDTQRLKSPRHAAEKRALQTTVDELKARFQMRQNSLAALEGGAAFPRAGFAGYFEDLASRPIEGLWLTSINLAEGGEVVELSGRALDAGHVPALLTALSKNTRFDGKRFGQLSVVADDAGGLGFVVGPAGGS